MAFLQGFRRWYGEQSDAVKAAVVTLTGTAAMALVATLFSAALGLFARDDSDLRLVDAQIIETDAAPELEVKLRNMGSRVAVLKRANFDVKRIDILAPGTPSRESLPVTGKYAATLPIKQAPYTESVGISHSLAPDEVDRFVFLLRSDAPAGERHAFLIDFELVYDEDDKSLRRRSLRFETTGTRGEE